MKNIVYFLWRILKNINNINFLVEMLIKTTVFYLSQVSVDAD